MSRPIFGQPLRARSVRVACAAVVALGLGVGLASPAPAATASATFVGHGWGHGRGMGQWGAYGYAVDHGWSGSAILDHFYGGTHTGVAPARNQQVALTGLAGADLIVFNTLGRLSTNADLYAGRRYALRIQRADDNHFRVYSGANCSGPWKLLKVLHAGTIRVKPAARNDDPRAMLQTCGGSSTRYYRGDLLATRVPGSTRIVNDVDTEALVRSVIAREVSPSWADAGGGRGAAAVRAQALAARSYVMAGDTRFAPYATTCDSTQCQVYSGYGTRQAGQTTITKVEDPRTDLATLATARQVRYFNGTSRVARTEFSSSSGGWSAGGDFPALPDYGDDTRLNPNHSWTVTLSAATIERAFQARHSTDVGAFVGIRVLTRDGRGDLGGRVLTVRVRFTDDVQEITGDRLRATLGLKSNWFAVTS